MNRSIHQTRNRQTSFKIAACGRSIGCRGSRRRRSRAGATLIDVALGTMLIASLMIPSLHLMRESQENTQRLAVRQTLLHTSEQQMEGLKVLLSEPAVYAATVARPINQTRNVTTAMGVPARVRVQAASDTSIAPATLLTLSVEAWYDADRDGAVDSDETITQLRTQWAPPR